jgi:hypothetical protein
MVFLLQRVLVRHESMKHYNIKNTGLFLAICFVSQTVSVTARITTLWEVQSNAEIQAQMTRSNAVAKAEYRRLHPAATNALTPHQLELLEINNNPAVRSNYFSQHHSPEELREFTNTVQYFLTNADAQSSYFFLLHGMTESEMLAKAARYMEPQPWPETVKKRVILKHCADIMRLAVNTHQIGTACGKLTNQPQAVVALEELTGEAISNLNEVAILLTNANLTTYHGPIGYQAEVSDSSNLFYFVFWSEKGLPTVVRNFEERTLDGQRVLIDIQFNENGKVMSFTVYSPESRGLGFNEDGSVRNYYAKSKNIWLP